MKPVPDLMVNLAPPTSSTTPHGSGSTNARQPRATASRVPTCRRPCGLASRVGPVVVLQRTDRVRLIGRFAADDGAVRFRNARHCGEGTYHRR
jgi:hypothetical protein